MNETTTQEANADSAGRANNDWLYCGSCGRQCKAATKRLTANDFELAWRLRPGSWRDDKRAFFCKTLDDGYNKIRARKILVDGNTIDNFCRGSRYRHEKINIIVDDTYGQLFVNIG